jgi:hypothetical protein
MLSAGLGLAWWRDRTRLSSSLDLRDRQITQLQRQLDERGVSIVSANIRFKSPQELVEFVSRATEMEFEQEDWSAFGGSYVADQSIEQLADLLSSPRGATRHHAAWLLGLIGQKKRFPSVDPISALVAVLDDPSSRVRVEALSALRQFGPLADSALSRLREVMDRDQSTEALLAALAIKQIEPATEIGPRLRELFLQGDVITRMNVMWHLPDHLPPAEAKQLLEAQYQRETDESVRQALAQAMNKVKE